MEALQLVPTSFPITFRYDEKRLKTNMRHEFQNIIVLALLLMPYRLMAGKYAKEEHITRLKTSYSALLKDASITSGRVSCFHLALKACNLAREVAPIRDDVVDLARYWSNWMHKNLRNASPVYKVMYDRVRSNLLIGISQRTMDGPQLHATIGLEPEIVKLGKKLIVLISYNKRTFRLLYNSIATTIH